MHFQQLLMESRYSVRPGPVALGIWAHHRSSLERLVEACNGLGAATPQHLGEHRLPLAHVTLIEDGHTLLEREATAQQCQRQYLHSQACVVVGWTSADDEREEQVMTAGADYYLAPLSASKLRAHWIAIDRRMPLTAERPVSVGPLSFDRSHKMGTLHGRRLDLTRKEFDILLCLAEQPGAQVSLGLLAQQVFSSVDSASSRACIRQHVYSIKRKNTELMPYLMTVRGGGYLLRANQESEPPGHWRVGPQALGAGPLATLASVQAA